MMLTGYRSTAIFIRHLQLSDDKLLRQLATCKTASSVQDSLSFQHKYFQMVEENDNFVFSLFLFERHMRAKIKFFQHFFCSPTLERDGGFLGGNIVMVSN